MSSEQFSIYYRSKSTEKHSIDAEVLGQSLVSLSKAIKDADKLVNGEKSELQINVKAHKAGSFGIDYEVIQHLNNAKDILQMIGITGAVGAVASGTVMGIIKTISNSKMTGVVKKVNNKSVITLDTGEIVECDSDIETLVTSPDFRQKFEDVFFTPIKSDDTASIAILDEKEEVLHEIKSTESVSYKKIDSKSVDSKEVEEEKHIRFTQVNFDSGAKGWRMELHGLENDVGVKVVDEAFLKRISESQQSLVKGSLFKVTLKTKTNFSINKPPRYTYTILNVIRHLASDENNLL
jgi:hypothetical protein